MSTDRPDLQLSDFQVQHAPHPRCPRSQIHSASACDSLKLLVQSGDPGVAGRGPAPGADMTKEQLVKEVRRLLLACERVSNADLERLDPDLRSAIVALRVLMKRAE